MGATAAPPLSDPAVVSPATVGVVGVLEDDRVIVVVTCRIVVLPHPAIITAQTTSSAARSRDGRIPLIVPASALRRTR